MAQQSITLKIAGKSYSLNIDREKEEVYRLAEREVNNYLKQIMKMKFQKWESQDYLSMAALKFAINTIDLIKNREVGADDLNELKALDSEIDTYLNTLGSEEH